MAPEVEAESAEEGVEMTLTISAYNLAVYINFIINFLYRILKKEANKI